ncbi:MAG: hypothetical protein Q4D23_11270 [Bacteroidales bacterium]|nr:hypothetical protein [Bacteroidales bacterium]
MKKIFICAAALATFGLGTASAQDIYKVEQVSTSDLDGDARFVGMGGAMGALGANISAMSTNPASTGLYRRNDMSLTAGLLAEPYNGTMQLGAGKTKGSFDQVGFVYSVDLENASGVKFVNMGFNYHKSKNFKNYIGMNNVALPKFMDNGVPQGMSQSWQFCDLAANLEGNLLDLGYDPDRELTTPTTLLAYDTYLIDAVDENGESVGERDVRIDRYVPSYANRYNYHRAQWGGIHDYDFNLSLNINERVYLGAVLGVHNVDMHSALLYDEELFQNGNVNDTGGYTMFTEETLTGSGVDGKFGLIVRPIEESPFRVGLSVTTPTAYDLESRAYAQLSTPYLDANGNTCSQNVELTNTYRIRTPWKLDVSAATTIGTRLALDAEYQMMNYSSVSVRYANTESWQAGNFSTDVYLQDEINNYLKNIHTLRVGAEARLSNNFSARLGYNYVTSSFDKDAYLNLLVDGSSYYYATNTDYVNLGATNRFTAGLGYHCGSFYFDVAYLHSRQNADVYAFHYNLEDRNGVKNDLPVQKFNLIRNQAMFTVGFKF